MPDSASGPTPDDEWDALVARLRTQPAARPQPFFYARLNARLAATAQPLALPAWLRRPAYAMLLGAVVLTLSGDGRALRPTATAAADGRNARAR